MSLETLQLGLENLGQRLWLNAAGVGRLGTQRWFWRLSYALWLDSWRGPAHRAARRVAPPPGWQAEDLIYGETPLATGAALLRRAQFPAQGRLVEIGCGRGVLCLLAHLAWGAHCTGYEVVPGLVARARWLAGALQAENVTFIEGDAGRMELPAADLYYLTPTTWGAANLKAVRLRLAEAAPPGCRAVSLTEPLGAGWQTEHDQPLLYSWGWSRTYWQVKL